MPIYYLLKRRPTFWKNIFGVLKTLFKDSSILDLISDKIMILLPSSLLFKFGCQFVCLSLVSTTLNNFLGLETTMIQWIGRILNMFQQIKHLSGTFL